MYLGQALMLLESKAQQVRLDPTVSPTARHRGLAVIGHLDAENTWSAGLFARF